MGSRGASRVSSAVSRAWPEPAFRQALEEAASCGAAVAGPDGRQSYVNAEFCHLVGWSEAELLNAAPPFVYWPPEERKRIETAYAATLRGEAPPEGFELRFQRRDGKRFDALVRVAPLRGGGGEALGWLAAVTDISERKLAERRRAAEQEVNRVLGDARTLAEAAPAILQALTTALDCDLGAFWKVDAAGERLRLLDCFSRPGAQAAAAAMTREFTFARCQGLPGSLDQDGRLRTHGLRSALLFPVTANGEVEGVAEFFSREDRTPDEELLATAMALSHRISQFLERERAEAAVRQSEERYRTIVETANEGVWLIDAAGRTLYSNHRLSEMLGYSTEELRTLTPLDCCFPEDLAAVRERIVTNVAGRREQFDQRFRRKDGSELRVLGSTSPVRAAGGRIIGALGLFSDVTGRKRTEEAVHRLAAIVESSDDAIISKSLDGTIQSWNPAAERIYGYPAAEAIGRSMTMLLPPDRPDEETAILQRLQRGERVEHFETVRQRKDGRIIHVSTTISPIRNKAGAAIGASSVTRDITDRKVFEERLRETQKLESLGVLAGGVAHDFNNLLVGILGNASLALDSIAPDNPSRPLLEGVLQAAERAAALTGQLLAYSGKGRFLIEPVDLSLMVREIVALIRTSIPKNVRLDLALGEGLPAVEADTAQMQQLIMNLVINAAEAIGEACGAVRVRTCAEDSDTGRQVRLEVEDGGCGMDDATREKIFDPFFTTKFTGRGLGLSAVLGIVRSHNGAIQVDTAPGRGSRFTVLLPATDVAAPSPPEAVAADYRGSGTVLVIDDESVVRETARLALESFGYRVLVAADGQAGIEQLRAEPDISMVLLDLTMPVMSGEETLEELKLLRPDLPVILSSGYNEVEAVRRFEGRGLAGFLQKPYTAERLAEKVKAANARE